MRTVALLVAALAAGPALAQAPKAVVQSNARQAPAGTPTLQLFGPGSSQSDLCIGEDSAAYGNAMLAVTVDLTRRDPVCARLRQSWFLSAHGYPAAAIQLQCLSQEVRLAMKLAGTPCERQVASSPSPEPAP